MEGSGAVGVLPKTGAGSWAYIYQCELLVFTPPALEIWPSW